MRIIQKKQDQRASKIFNGGGRHDSWCAQWEWMELQMGTHVQLEQWPPQFLQLEHALCSWKSWKYGEQPWEQEVGLEHGKWGHGGLHHEPECWQCSIQR